MPRYDFVCEDCQQSFEISCSMNDIETYKPVCEYCGNDEKVYRDFSSNIFVFGGPVTVGSLVDKNTGKLSADERTYLHEQHNAYRKQEYTGPKPMMKE